MTIKFEYPYASPTVELTLKNPQLGDAQHQDIKIRHRFTMDKIIHTHKFTAATSKFFMQFEWLTPTDYDNFKTFLTAVVDDSDIKVTDQRDDQTQPIWRVKILNTLFEVTEWHPDTGACRVYSVVIEVEGRQTA